MAVKSRKDLLIFPFNGNAIEALDCIGDDYRLIGFVDDTEAKRKNLFYGYPVYDRSAFTLFPDAAVLAIPGSPSSYLQRKEIIKSLGLRPERFARVIHPKASVSSLAVIGTNILLMAGVVITSTAKLGSHLCVLPNTVIHHDVKVGDWALVGSNVTIAGNSEIGENCYIGSGASIINNISVGENSLIGLGSVVVKDVPSEVRMVGNPARQLASTSKLMVAV